MKFIKIMKLKALSLDRRKLFLSALTISQLLFLCLTGCTNRPSVSVGMKSDDVVKKLGSPLRTEPTDDGGEDWFYNAKIATYQTAKPRSYDPVSSNSIERNTDGSVRNMSFEYSEPTDVTVKHISTYEVAISISSSGVVEGIPAGDLLRNK